MTLWTAVGACAAVVAAIVAVVSAFSSKKSKRTTEDMQANLTAAIQQIAETGAPAIAFRVDRGSTSLPRWTGYVLRNIGKEEAQIVKIKTDSWGNISVDGLPVILGHDDGHSFALLQGTSNWGTTHTIAVTINGREKPFHVPIPFLPPSAWWQRWRDAALLMQRLMRTPSVTPETAAQRHGDLCG